MPYLNYEEHRLNMKFSYLRNRNARLERSNKYYRQNRKQRLLYAAIRRGDPEFQKKKHAYNRQWKTYCRACRRELRRLVAQFPTVAEHLGINLDDATNGQVRQCYDQLLEDMRNGNFTYTTSKRTTRKGKTKTR